MNYEILLNTTYANMQTCELSEIAYYRNIADNLQQLQRENKVVIDMGNSSENYVWNMALDMNLTELEFNMILPRFRIYISKGFDNHDAFQAAMVEVLGKID